MICFVNLNLVKNWFKLHFISVLKDCNKYKEKVSRALTQSFAKDVPFSFNNVFEKNITQYEIIKYELWNVFTSDSTTYIQAIT